MKGLKELMEMKGRMKQDPMAKKAKLGVLGDIGKMATGMMGNDLHGLKKVTVAAPDKTGLEMGLSKAKDMMGKEDPEMEDEEGSDAEEASETPSMEADEEKHEGADLDTELEKVKTDPSLENIDALMKLLEDKKNEMMGTHESDDTEEEHKPGFSL
jgi:hypothetical protein